MQSKSLILKDIAKTSLWTILMIWSWIWRGLLEVCIVSL